MNNGIFFIDKDENLVEMLEKSFDSEDLLQGLLAKYPNLISGEQIDKTNPRRWLFISREVPLPDSGDSSGRWAIDHLFLDQDAVPTIIEVKRSSDTRIRREIVGQMLDYAANAVVYWSVEKLVNLFEKNCKNKNLNPEEVLQKFLNNSLAVEDFWQQVKTNLQAGKIRLIFVADIIPFELQRIVEFLNEQMDPTEVLAFEIKQFLGKDATRTLIPRIFGQTAEAQKRKNTFGSPLRQWDKESFLEELKVKFNENIENIASKILDWAKEKNIRLWWGKGSIHGSCYLMFDYNDTAFYTISIWTYGKLDVQFAMIGKYPPFNNLDIRKEFINKLNIIDNIEIHKDSYDRFPSIELKIFKDSKILDQFLKVIDWYLEEIKNYYK